MRKLPVIAAACVLMLVMGITLGSCSDASCYDNGSSLPLATFYIDDNQQTITGLTVMGIGVPGDSMLLNSASAQELYMPLRPNATSTSYLLQRTIVASNDTICFNDTITFDYKPIEFFHSIECGAMFNFEVNEVSHTSNAIDSVVMLTTLITNTRTPAMRIYFTDFDE